jgi:uncharacterized FAD-dependent dehydrogenase
VKVVENMREQIIALGGEIRFEQRVTDVLIEDGQLRGLTVLDQATGESSELRADHVVLALGHSSRDTFAMLHARGVYIEAKPFSIGFRVEHPQGLIDRARWGRTPATRCWARPTTSWCTTRATAARSTASACARAARWWRHQRAGPRGHQRHEPVFAQRAQRQCRASWWASSRATSRATRRASAAGIALQRELESNAFVLAGADYTRRRTGRRLHRRQALDRRRHVCPRTSRAYASATCTPLPAYAIEAMREAFRPSAARSRASTCTTRC